MKKQKSLRQINNYYMKPNIYRSCYILDRSYFVATDELSDLAGYFKIWKCRQN